MCGRYTLTADAQAIQLAFQLDDVSAWAQPRFNIAPSQQVSVITDRDPKVLQFFKWGLIPFWAKDPAIGQRMINARSETAAEKPSFRTAFKRRRCLIPADGYFEWQKRGGRKVPIYIQRNDCEIFAMAGLWESWKQHDGSALHSCAILTTEANDTIRPIHHRMVVMIEPEDHNLWLAPRELIQQEWLPLMAGCPSDKLRFYEVSTEVNRPVNDNPSVIVPVVPPTQPDLL
ncbi:MAG: SOS response-associated peptidase [Chloroflexi bacterium]|nr:SOS response-associated peptidase [Chloroflexota bacterium]